MLAGCYPNSTGHSMQLCIAAHAHAGSHLLSHPLSLVCVVAAAAAAVMPDSEDAAPPGDGLLDALSQSPLGGLAQAFEEGRQQVRGQRAKGENPSLKSLASRVRNVVRRDSAAAAEEQEQEEGEDEYVEVEEAPKAAKHPARKAVADDVDVEIDQAANEEESDDVTANVESTTSKHGSHAKGDAYSAKEKDYTYGHNKKEHSKHHAEEQEEKEDYPAAKEHKHSKEYEEHEEHENKKHTKHSSSKDTASYEDKDAYTKPIDKKSYYEKRAASQSQSESESQSEAEGQDKAEKQPQAAKSEPKEAVSKPQPTSGRSTFADKPEQKQNTLGRAGGKKSASSGPRKMPPTKADPEVVKQLIPGLPLEEDDEEQVASKKAATPQQPAKDAKAPAPAAAPAGPVTLKDIAKKLGAAFGATAPVSNPMGNPMGFIDPEALADAGLPPVSNVGQLMGALMKRQMGECRQEGAACRSCRMQAGQPSFAGSTCSLGLDVTVTATATASAGTCVALQAVHVLRCRSAQHKHTHTLSGQFLILTFVAVLLAWRVL